MPNLLRRRSPTSLGESQLGAGPNTSGLNQGNSVNRDQQQQRRATQIGNVPQPVNDGTRSVSQDDSDRQQAWNTQAANQYEALHGLQLSNASETDDEAVKHEQSRIALARAMGYDPRNMPPMSQMMQRWATLPLPTKAGIIKAGGAQFLDPQQGQEQLQKLADQHDSIVQDQIKNVASDLSKGDAQLQRDPQTGKLSGYKWVEDPTKFPGTSPKIKMPFNDVQDMALQTGLKNGSIFNPAPDPTQGQAPIQPQLPSTGQFQQILDARAANPGVSLPLNLNASGTVGAGAPPPMTTEQFQQVLNARAAGQDTPSSVVNNILRRPRSGSSDDIDAEIIADNSVDPKSIVSSQNPLSSDPATRIGQTISNLGQQANNALLDPVNWKALGGTLVDTASAFPNSILQAVNAVSRGFTGATGIQQAQIPLIPQVANSLPDDPRKTSDIDDAANLANQMGYQ